MTLKTKSKYLSFGTLVLIIMLIIVQIAYGFTGILLLSLSKFVLYGLTMNFTLPALLQTVSIIGLALVIISAMKLNYSGRFFNSMLSFIQLQPSGTQSIDFMSGPLMDNSDHSMKSLPATEQPETKDPENEEGMFLVSSGYILFANKAFFKISGYQPFEILGKDFSTLIRPESLINYTMLSRLTTVEIKKTKGIGLITRSKSRNLVCYLGSEKEYVADGVNIFHLKRSESVQNNRSNINSLFYDAIENVDSLQWIWDEKGTIYLNNSCRKNIPFTLGRIISNPGLMLKLVKKDSRAAVRLSLKQYFETGDFSEDICCRMEDGTEKYFRLNITSDSESTILPIRHHAIAVDITEEKHALLRAEASIKTAELANKNKTNFLANMSHEIRSPLNGIIGFSELLADKNLTDAERERYLNIIQNNGNALITLLTDLIDISKLESDNLEISKQKFVPAKLMEDLKNQFMGSTLGVADDVRFIFPNIKKYSEQFIESDPHRLRQILLNLITNAIKFTSKGIIEVGYDFASDEMIFWVRDTGIGIPYENQDTIFERFKQVGTHVPSDIFGFGLGLAISKALAEKMGGHLWAESIPDKGSLFAFTIKTNIVNNTMETIQLNNNSYPYDFSERTILIAEDIDFSFLYIEAVLRRTGAKILWAQNGKEAVDHVKINQSIDLVLMDMHMPVMGGYEAAEQISLLRPGLTIIAQTAFVLPADVKKCFSSGCSGFLAKPIRKEQLLNTLAEYFDKMDQNSANQPMYKVGIG